ncbi:MAG: hypothetical protein F9K18_03245 [Thermoanaerobaculia bacterium]|nr:MAG: hypothetical protein F9K18_03245 [Thermoanaerobaculia bacterium]
MIPDARLRRLAAALFGAAALAAAAAPADVEDTLRARLRGRWAVVTSPIASECTDHYTDNVVAGRHASGPGPVLLPAGELVSIDNVDVGPLAGLSVNLGLLVPYRVETVDGPFTLHEHRRCRVQLKFDVSREVRRDAARAEEAVLAVLEVHDSATSARGSQAWNRREPEALPAGSEEVWAEYRVWKAQQVNAAVRRRLEEVLADAQATLRAMRDEPEYLESFAAGVAARRHESPGDCDALLGASFYVSGSGGPSKRGWEDGQRVAWASAVARGLTGCFVDVPPAR